MQAAKERAEALRAALIAANRALAEARTWTSDEPKALIDEAIDFLDAALAADDAKRGERHCLTCGKAMGSEGSGDDRDCGGDCWGCMRVIAPDDPDVRAADDAKRGEV